MFNLYVEDVDPAEAVRYTGARFNSESGDPYVNPADRSDYLEQVAGSVVYSERPGVPNALDLQSDAIGATDGVSGDDNGAMGYPALAPDPAQGYSPIPQFFGEWYDSLRPNAGYPLPVPVEFGDASQFPAANDEASIHTNWAYGIDDYVRFGQPQLVADGHRITERTLDVPVSWKANPTFPATIQKVRPWDKALGAWPWTGTKAAIPQEISPPNYFPKDIPDGVVSPGGNSATIPNTPSLSPLPMTWRVIPEQWDTNYVNSGV